MEVREAVAVSRVESTSRCRVRVSKASAIRVAGSLEECIARSARVTFEGVFTKRIARAVDIVLVVRSCEGGCWSVAAWHFPG